MDSTTKKEIGMRLRVKREEAGYTREQLGELCSLSPRFIANVELGDSTFSIDSITTVCRVLSCSADYLLFGYHAAEGEHEEIISKIRHLNPKYQKELNNMLRCFLEVIVKAEHR